MSFRGALNVFDLQEIARRRLPRGVYGFVEGGVEDNQSRDNNRAVFDRIRFRPRSPVDVSQRSQEVQLFGRKFSSPFGIAPMGIASVFAFDGDLQMAKAAARMNVPFTLSNMSTVPMETVAEQADHARWLQAYLSNVRERAAKFTSRAKAAGYDLLMITVDTPVGSNRENNIRNSFTLPVHITPRLLFQGATHPRWSLAVFTHTLVKYGVPRLENTEGGDRPSILAGPDKNLRHRRDAVDWEFIRFLRDQWAGRLLVKGTLHPTDAEMALRVGLDGIVVSNHGGRQLDGAISPIEALPDIRAVAGKNLKIIADSGFRRGTDILKGLALGADFILIGRAAMFGAIAGGEEGVVHALSLLKAEVDRDLALLGCPSIGELTPDFLDTRDLFHGRFLSTATEKVRPVTAAASLEVRVTDDG
jgi:L-lactate dehydrogenase (cytochrome)